MNILFVTPRLHPNYSDSLEALSKLHNVTTLLALEAGCERYSNLKVVHFPDGLVSYLLKKVYALWGLAPIQIAYRKRHPSLFWMIRFIRNNEIDVVYARQDNIHLYRTARLAAKLTGCRSIKYSQQLLSEVDSNSKNSIHTICCRLHNQAVHPINYIPLCINTNRLENLDIKKKSFPKNENYLSIITVGKLIERKGHQIIIEAITKLQKKLPIKLYIYGDYSPHHSNKFKSKLVDLISRYGLEDTIILMPKIEPENMINEYIKHDLFIYAGWVSNRRDPDYLTYSRANGQNGTQLFSLIEAMSVGLPVVCASEMKVVGAVENGKNGLVFEKGSSDDLAEKIEAIYAMDMKAMGKHSSDLVYAYYNANKFPILFEKLLNA